MANNDKNMLAEFLTCVFRFAWKLLLWSAWAVFRLLEIISKGIAEYIKNQLNN